MPALLLPLSLLRAIIQSESIEGLADNSCDSPELGHWFFDLRYAGYDAGLVETLKVGDSIQKAGCSAAIVPDDILFGNLTSNGRQFFTGFFNIAGQVGELQANLDNIANNFSILVNGSSNPTIENALSLCQTAKTAAVKISNNDLVGSPLVLQYPTPIN